MSSGDCIRVSDLRVECVIGVDGWERGLKQEVYVDVTLHGDLSGAGGADDLTRTVDYRALCEAVVVEMSGSHHLLIEAFAEHVAAICLAAHESVERVSVRVRKPRALSGFGSASVEVEIERASAGA